MAQLLDRETLRKIQLLELLCLDEVVRICEKHNLKYFLIGGTLIGAVRDKGFIPWDDDIDIGMLREDFEKFIEICKTDIDTNKFFFQIPETEKGCADFGIARIRLNGTHFVEAHRRNLKIHNGFFVEILPYDALPENDRTAKWYYYSFKYLKRIVGLRMGYKYKMSSIPKRIFLYVLTFFSYIFPLKYLYNKVNNYHKKYVNPDSEKIFLKCGAYNYKKETHSRASVQKLETLEFEGKQYPVPNNYDAFLREEYGDYMTPPPPEKQINPCLVESVDFGPYEEYLKNK